MTYDPNAVLHAIDHHTAAVLLLFGATWAFQFIWWGAAIHAALRDRAYPIPLSCTFLWLAHDLNFDGRYHTWFHTYDHWFLKAFWIGMVVTAGLELFFLYLTWKLGRDELFPSLSATASAALLILGAGAIVLMFSATMTIVDDPIFVIAPALTLVFYGPAGTALLLHRRSTRGQSTSMWIAYTTMVVLYFTATATIYPHPFHSALWIGLGASAIAWGLATTLAVHHLTNNPPGGTPSREMVQARALLPTRCAPRVTTCGASRS